MVVTTFSRILRQVVGRPAAPPSYGPNAWPGAAGLLRITPPFGLVADQLAAVAAVARSTRGHAVRAIGRLVVAAAEVLAGTQFRLLMGTVAELCTWWVCTYTTLVTLVVDLVRATPRSSRRLPCARVPGPGPAAVHDQSDTAVRDQLIEQQVDVTGFQAILAR